MSTAIELVNVSKLYKLGAGHGSLRGAFGSFAANLLNRDVVKGEDLEGNWAVKDVSFVVPSGEILGIIGANGAGKTTILKMLSGVTRPTEGEITVSGRLSSLIELGAGFHPDLSGRENIYLNGAILGMEKREIDDRFDAIVEFSGLEPFLDTPVKRYSSGMYVRLGFSVAAHVDPEILLVDEVLAVGDHEFRAKCMQRFQTLQEVGVTTVIIAHNRHLIESLCSRALFLEHGRIRFDGEPGEAWDVYLSIGSQALRSGKSESTKKVSLTEISITKVELIDEQNQPKRSFAAGEVMRAMIDFEINGEVNDPVFYARIFRDGQLIHGTNTARQQISSHFLPGEKGAVTIEYASLNLLEGMYVIQLGIEKSFHSRAAYDRGPDLIFQVVSNLEDGVGMVHMSYSWMVNATDLSQNGSSHQEDQKVKKK